ncbi:hypothetical protein [Bdellovibrio sp. BCCA]|uniref:hypothetical protein n=1 Tax=Bdellovibrio sp. BCCA TaxID=3136281 RepID=UPI0030F25D74
MVIQNQKGSALAIILAVLPVFIAGALLCFSLLGILQNDLGLKYQCRVEGQNGQKRVAPLLSSLLALNPVAVAVKAELAEAILELEAAIASENPVAIAKATKHYTQVLEKRDKLDHRQKQLIKQSDLLLQQSHTFTSMNLRRTGGSASNILLKVDLDSVRGKAPKLAVRPDSPDIAPTYSPVDDFENKQALAHEWQYRVQVRPPFSNFLKGEFSFKKACAVSLAKENSSWLPKIIVGKYSLKSVW